MHPLRVGVIGCGVMGDYHAKYTNTHPAANVAAMADIIAERADSLAGKHGVPKTYASGSALLDDPEIDAVTIAMPVCYRTELALKAFAQGKHVLNEKPTAMNAAEVEQMIAARGELIAGCCSSRYHFLASARAVDQLVADGVLGEIRTVHCRCLMGAAPEPEEAPPAWRLIKSLNGGGILLNWGIYDVDYLMGITGWQLKPELVLAQTWTIPPTLKSYIPEESDAETHFVALFRCADGKVITHERAEYVTAQPTNAWTIVGDRATLHLEMLHGKKKIVLDRPDPVKGNVSETVWEGEDTFDMVHEGLIHDFIDAIRENRPCKTSLEQALIIQKMSDAIYESAETGQAVRIL